MTRHDFQSLDLKAHSTGEVFTIEGVDYRLLDYTWLRWCQRAPVSNHGVEGFVRHPKVTGLVLLACDKTVVCTVENIKINIDVISYFTRGPSGLYAHVRGSVGDSLLNASAVLAGSYQKRDFIEPIVIGNHLFHIEYSTNYFSLACFEIQ